MCAKSGVWKCFDFIVLAIGFIRHLRLHAIGSIRPLLDANFLWRGLLWQTSHTIPMNNDSRQPKAVGCLVKTGVYFWHFWDIKVDWHNTLWYIFTANCYVMILLGSRTNPIHPHSSWLPHSHWRNRTVAPMPVKQPWRIWINVWHEATGNDNITTHKKRTTKAVHIIWDTLYILKGPWTRRPVVSCVTTYTASGCLNPQLRSWSHLCKVHNSEFYFVKPSRADKRKTS